MKKILSLAAAAALALGSLSAQAVDFTAAIGQSGDSTMVYRLGAQWNWDSSWWQSSVGRLTGYWDAGYTYWEGDETSGNHSLSFSPVFVYEFAGESVQPYIEAGIGVAAFTSSRTLRPLPRIACLNRATSASDGMVPAGTGSCQISTSSGTSGPR